MFRCGFFLSSMPFSFIIIDFSQTKMISVAIHLPYYMHQHRLHKSQAQVKEIFNQKFRIICLLTLCFSQICAIGSSLGSKSGPPPRPESPSPALPPKKAKQPPPRPAPPRPMQVNSHVWLFSAKSYLVQIRVHSVLHMHICISTRKCKTGDTNTHPPKISKLYKITQNHYARCFPASSHLSRKKRDRKNTIKSKFSTKSVIRSVQ